MPMTIHTVPLGDKLVAIMCPQFGEVDPFAEVPVLPVGNVGDTPTFYGLDVETNGGDDGLDPWAPGFEVRTVQLAPDDRTVWVLRMDDPAQRQLAQQVLGWAGNTFASHTKIDVHAVLTALGVDITGRYIDTHPLAVMAAPDDRAGLAKLKPVAARYAMPELGAAEAALDARFEQLYRFEHPEIGRRAIAVKTLKSWGFGHIDLDDPAFLVYAGLDAVTARRLVPLLAASSRAPAHLLRRERWLSQQAAQLEQRGMLVDRDRLDQVQDDAQAVEDRAAETIDMITGLKTTQGVALQRWLGEHGVDWDRWPKTMRTPKDAPSLAKENIYVLRRPEWREPMDAFAVQVVESMIEHAGVSDKLTRCKQIRAALDPSGRVHPTLNTVGTVTSRMSGSGPNMQNFAKSDPTMRGVFLFEPGTVGITCDFKQIELRVMAALAGESSMIEVILDGGDLHQLTADKLDISRDMAKPTNFLIVYGGGGDRLAAQLKHTITGLEGKRIVRDYWRQYPEIKALKDSLANEPGVRLISGRYVPTGSAHLVLNYLIQGSARELLVASGYRYAHSKAGRERTFWMPIHDEWVLQVPEDDAADAARAISAAMTFDFYGVPVEADADLMIDPDGISRWMSGDTAQKYAKARLGK